MKTILLLGKTGQIGRELARGLAGTAHIAAPGRLELDLANPDAIVSAIRTIKPDIIVNAAAYTDVDRAESAPDVAMAINGVAPGIMAEEAKRINASLIHYSTDYVFDGLKAAPYSEDDATNPINVYGKTKLEGETAIQSCAADFLIFRTAWVYGLHGDNFLRAIIKRVNDNKLLQVVNDEFGTPTWSRTVADFTSLAISSDAVSSGIYHLTAAGQTNRYGFASAILVHATPALSNGVTIVPIASSTWPAKAKRPKWSVLATQKLQATLDVVLPHWEDSLAQCLAIEGIAEQSI